MDNFSKVLSEEDTKKIIKEEIEKYGVNNHVRDIIFSNKIKNLGMYIPNEKKMIINYNNIFNYTYYLFKQTNCNTSAQYNRLCNIVLLNVIHHELNHALQFKESQKEDNDTLHKIIKEGIEFGSRLPGKLSLKESLSYKFMYKKILIERNAEIMALVNLLNSDVKVNGREKAWLKDRLDGLVKYGYSNTTTPIKEYYKLRNKMKEYKELDLYLGYDLVTRLSWGMPEKKENIENAVSKKLILNN